MRPSHKEAPEAIRRFFISPCGRYRSVSARIDHRQSLFSGITDGVGGAARFGGEITQADPAAVHQPPVALKQAPWTVGRGHIHHLIGPRPDSLVPPDIAGGPASGLVGTGKHENQLHLRARPLKPDHSLGGQGVEAQSASRAEIDDAPCRQRLQLFIQPPLQPRQRSSGMRRCPVK